jgi:hypothetical protein
MDDESERSIREQVESAMSGGEVVLWALNACNLWWIDHAERAIRGGASLDFDAEQVATQIATESFSDLPWVGGGFDIRSVLIGALLYIEGEDGRQ